MDVTESGITTEVSPVPRKVLAPIVVMPSPKVAVVSEITFSNTPPPIDCTELGIRIELSAVPRKAESPIANMPGLMTAEMRYEELQKAHVPTVVTVFGSNIVERSEL